MPVGWTGAIGRALPPQASWSGGGWKDVHLFPGGKTLLRLALDFGMTVREAIDFDGFAVEDKG